MPRSVVIFRLGTGLVTLALVALVMGVGGDKPAAKWIAGGILAFGVMQWLFLGRLGRTFAVEERSAEALDGEEGPR